MKIRILTLFFVLLSGFLWTQISSANKQNKVERLKNSCNQVVKTRSAKIKNLDKYCTCWSENMATISEKNIQVILKYQRGGISSKDLENKHSPLVEFELKVSENCLDKPNWRIKK